MPIQVAVTFRHVEPSDALRRYAEGKVGRLAKFLRRSIEAHVVLSVLKHRHVAEITLSGSRLSINATEETGDLYSAIDLAVGKIERQIKKDVAKRQDRKHGGEMNAAPVAPPSGRRPTIETERLVLKPMSVREALAQLGKANSEFVVFQNAATETLNVLYRRKNGSYGLIEPESV